MDSGLSITRNYLPVHLEVGTSKFQLREARDVWRLRKKFWTAKMRGNLMGLEVVLIWHVLLTAFSSFMIAAMNPSSIN